MVDLLPANWVTMQSLGSWAGMVSMILAAMSLFYLRWADAEAVQDGGVSAALVINILAAVFRAPVTAQALFLAILNGIATGVTAIILFRTVVRPRLDKYHDDSES